MENKLNINSSYSLVEKKPSFSDRHIGPSEAEVKEMLDKLEFSTLEELIQATVPNQILLDAPLTLDNPMSEEDALEYLSSKISQNNLFKSYIGMGYSNTITPSVILRNILENPGWYTAYTPYQPEVSQGRLEMLINFQQMIMDFTGLEVANASLLDEGTAAVEAMILAFRHSKDDRCIFLVSEFCHPQTIDLLHTRAEPLGIEIKVGDLDLLIKENPNLFFGFIGQYPNTLGQISDFKFALSQSKAQSSISILACDLLSLTLLKSPGELGADIAVGSSQRFGVPIGFGGPHAAFISCREEYKRLMPGRIIGRSIDKNNNLAYRMALQTREQHIRREKATSNICTAQSLLAIISSFYAIYHGPNGLTEIAKRIVQMRINLESCLADLGFEIPDGIRFDSVDIFSEHAQKIHN